MFNKVTYSNNTLLFHTDEDVDQAGAGTTLRLAGLTFTKDTVSLGKYGPFPLPSEVREASAFQNLLAINDGTAKVRGQSKSPRKRPDWSLLTYAYRLYAEHQGVVTDRDTPPLVAQMIESKRLLWNALCSHCQLAIEKGQTITTEILNELAIEIISTLTAFNDALGRSKDKIPFPKDDSNEVPAKRVSQYFRFLSYLRHLAEDGRPVPAGLEQRVKGVLDQYPYDWSHFREFEKGILAISAELAKSMTIPTSIASPVIQTFRSAFKKRRTLKMKGFDGVPRRKDARDFNWFHEFSFGSGGVKVTNLNKKGSSSLRFGKPVSPELSGHPQMTGRKAEKRLLRPITFTIEGQEVTFAMMMHRPLPENGLLKQWRLVYCEGEYWVNFILEIPPYFEPNAEVGGVAALDLNWRVLPAGGILLGMLADGHDDTMIVFDPDRSPRATDEGGMIETGAKDGFRVVSFRVGPSRWGRNNIRKNVNYGVPDTFEGARQIRALRDRAKDDLKIRISQALGDDAPSYLSRCGARRLKQFAVEFTTMHPVVSDDIRNWATHDADLYRVTRKISETLDGRIKRGYDQLAHHLCRKLAERGIKRLVIEENFLKKVAEAEKKYKPVALQKSAHNRQAVGASNFVSTLEHLALKYGISLSRRNAAYTTTRCRFCGSTCEFGAKRTAQCPGCSRDLDQDQNAAHNLRNAELDAINSPIGKEIENNETKPVHTWVLTIGRVSPGGEIRQKRDIQLTGSATRSLTA